MHKTFESTSRFIGLNTELLAFEHLRDKKNQANKNTMSLSNKNKVELHFQDLNPFVCLRETYKN